MTGLAAAGPYEPATFAKPRGLVGTQRLLDLDPDLGRLLEGDRRAAARNDLWVRVHHRARGPWPIKPVSSDTLAQHLGVLVIDGVIASDVQLEDVVSTELLGAGDIARPWALDSTERLLSDKTQWMILTECRVVLLDKRFASALSRFPEVYAVLLQRMDQRARRLATTQAIAELTRVDRRLLNLLWYLAERWGRVTADGVLVPLDISHRLLGQLVGARRPTVSTAIGQLTREGLVHRRADGAWLLHGDPPSCAGEHRESVLSRRRLFVEQRSQHVSRHPQPFGIDLAD
jgi:CRP/FNR family transcriptional regulator, cyclic AMP receptor protein